MFSGKSEELIRRLRRAQIARQRVQIFKPAFDNRFAESEIVSHSEMRIQGVNVGSSAELLRLINDDTEVVGIDEAQFFDKDLPAACTQLAGSGRYGASLVVAFSAAYPRPGKASSSRSGTGPVPSIAASTSSSQRPNVPALTARAKAPATAASCPVAAIRFR